MGSGIVRVTSGDFRHVKRTLEKRANNAPGEARKVRESTDSAYVHKATLKVMLEQDYLKGNATYSFKDEREKQLNEYSSQIIRKDILPKLTKEINNAKRYAPLRQVYYSLILAQWFKARNQDKSRHHYRQAGRIGEKIPKRTRYL